MSKHFDIEEEYCEGCGYEVSECICDPTEVDSFE